MAVRSARRRLVRSWCPRSPRWNRLCFAAMVDRLPGLEIREDQGKQPWGRRPRPPSPEWPCGGEAGHLERPEAKPNANEASPRTVAENRRRGQHPVYPLPDSEQSAKRLVEVGDVLLGRVVSLALSLWGTTRAGSFAAGGRRDRFGRLPSPSSRRCHRRDQPLRSRPPVRRPRGRVDRTPRFRPARRGGRARSTTSRRSSSGRPPGPGRCAAAGRCRGASGWS